MKFEVIVNPAYPVTNLISKFKDTIISFNFSSHSMITLSNLRIFSIEEIKERFAITRMFFNASSNLRGARSVRGILSRS
jgi:hypothetical protein